MVDQDPLHFEHLPYHSNRAFVLIVNDLRDWLFPFAVVNLMWVLLSLTVILLPPATAALFATVHDAYFNRGPSPRRYWEHVRRWARFSYGWALALIVSGAGLLAAYRWSAQAGFAPGQVVVLVLVCVLLVSQYYFWPYLMTQDRPAPLRALRNSLYTVIGDLAMFLLYVAGALFVMVPGVVLIAPVIFILPVFLAMLPTYSLLRWLAHHGHLPQAMRNV